MGLAAIPPLTLKSVQFNSHLFLSPIGARTTSFFLIIIKSTQLACLVQQERTQMEAQ